MIVQLSERVKTLVKQKRELEKFRDEFQDLNLTISEIHMVTLEAGKLKSSYQLIYPRLPEVRRAEVESRVQELVNQVKESKQDFSTHHRQTRVLKNIAGYIRGLNADIEVSWKLAAEAVLGPYYELYSLVRQLPDFQSKEAELAKQRSRLDYFKNNLPKNIDEMREFDRVLEKFKQGLASIQGLTPGIQAFLTKVVSHTATIADLNDEILTWCKQSGRGKVFQIQFKN